MANLVCPNVFRLINKATVSAVALASTVGLVVIGLLDVVELLLVAVSDKIVSSFGEQLVNKTKVENSSRAKKCSFFIMVGFWLIVIGC